jgi:alkylhydroperoxidase/carboxymuconolactone decarboxylase family protein YurZ
MTRIGEVSLDEVRDEAVALVETLDEGEPLDESTAALIALGVRVTASALDNEGARAFAERALDAGATPEQVHETLVLVSGIGVHTLMAGSPIVAGVLRERGHAAIDAPLDDRRRELWERHVGSDPFWVRFEHHVPGFLDALIRLSPEAFEGFFAYSALPWGTRALPPLTNELIAMAADATPSHRYLPGMRLHLENAIGRGAGRAAILQALDIAAAAPEHRGVR